MKYSEYVKNYLAQKNLPEKLKPKAEEKKDDKKGDSKSNFKSRHNCDKKKNKLTAGYWACNYNW